MSDDGGQTIGVWIGPGDEELVAAFDDLHNDGDGTYSRSREIKHAMDLAVTIEETLESAGLDDLEGRGRSAFIRQAILDQARQQRADDV